MINALHELKTWWDPGLSVFFPGRTPLEESKKQVKDLELSKDVIFTGFRKDIKILYADATFMLTLRSTKP